MSQLLQAGDLCPAATFDELTGVAPEKSLLVSLKKKAGRNSRGVVTVRHRGGGIKRKLRLIDFKRDKIAVPGRIASIEYDPNRAARIALVHYADGEKRYILAPLDIKLGDTIQAGEDVDIKPGNALPLEHIPAGALVHNVEFEPGKGGQLVQSAGNSAQIISKEGKYVVLKLPSGELRRFHQKCWATIGQIGNVDHQNITVGKAGRSRWFCSLIRKGDKSYGVEMGLWQRISTSDNIDWDSPFVIKPLQSSKTRGVHIWHPQKLPGSATRTKITNVSAENGDSYIQKFYEPQKIGVNGTDLFMMYRIYFGYNIGNRDWDYLGGLWNARPNLKIHGASDSVFGHVKYI